MNLLDKKSSRFSELYSDYYPVVFATIRTKVDNITDAEDITNEVFMRFFENMDEVEDNRKWIFATLRNVVYEYYRKNKPSYDIDTIFQDATLTFVNGFRDTRIIIDDALDNNENYGDEIDRLIFDMIAIQNFTYAQTGKQLGFTRNQVKYRYSLIVKRITEYLGQKGIKSLEDLL